MLNDQKILFIPNNSPSAFRYAKIDAIMCSHEEFERKKWDLRRILEYNINLKYYWTN
jgi:hypothetical protein